MPLEAPMSSAPERARELNDLYRHADAADMLARALDDPRLGAVALVSSFGAESAVLLHMVAQIDRRLPVIFLDTRMLFAETLAYQSELAGRLGLRDLRIVRPDPEQLFLRDPDGLLHRSAPDACCRLRKSGPMRAALSGFDAWITGRKRFHGGARQSLRLFEGGEDGRIRINPLAHWSRDDLRGYMARHRLPPHPLVGRGYASIGCAPCTTGIAPDEPVRAGRWRGLAKTECGIHLAGGGAEPEGDR